MNKITLIILLLNSFMQCNSQKENTMLPNIDNKSESFSKKMDNSRLEENFENKKVIYTSANVGFSEVQYFNHSYFMVIKNFYPSKLIENKGISFNDGSEIGIWYFFDEKGSLINEKNMDEGYDFSPEDIIRYCKKNKIPLPKGYQETGFRTSVLKEEIQGKKVWKISHQTAADKIEEIILDGKSGKEINKKTISFLNN